MVENFSGNNFNFYKFKVEMVLATKDIWKIMDNSELPPPFTVIDNDKKHMSDDARKHLPSLSLAWWTNLAHIKGCKGLKEAWKTLCGIY